MKKFQLCIKRIFDICVALVLTVLLIVIPVLIIIPIVIRLTSKGPAVFTQERAGKDGKIFKIYKFRTMLIPEESLDKDGNMLPPAKRITKIGSILRKTSLDELMQLFNVLNGTMSIVGPRPTLPYQVENYTDEQKKRLNMRPGITGLAQVNGRNDLSWTEKIVYDVEYVDNFSLWLDIKILFKTVKTVFKKEGIEFVKNDAINSKKDKPQDTSDKKKALVVAGGVSQAALIQELKNQGIFTILADRNPNAFAVKYADAFYPVSTLDIDGIKKLAIDQKVDFVITACADQVLLVVAKVCEELGLPCYIDYNTAKLVSDKTYMKEIFEKSGVPTSKHVVMATFDEEKIKDFEYPLVVKPVDSYSSRGVRKVLTLEEAKTAFEEAAQISRTKTALVEEFCEGIELTTDIYVEDGKVHVLTTSVSDKIADKDRFVIYRTKNPAPISDEIKAQIEDTAQKIADAFNLKNSPMLVQMISNGKKISVLEFCARTGGSIKFRIIKKASGFDVIKAVVDLTLGKKPHVGELKSENKYITNTFLYCMSGVFDHVEGFEELKNEGVISEYWIFAAKGTKYDTITCSGDRMGSFTVQSDDIEELRRKHQIAIDRVRAISEDGEDLIRHDLVTELIYE